MLFFIIVNWVDDGFGSVVGVVVNLVEVNRGFEEMVVGMIWKYYMLGGKGGVGKISFVVSLVVKFVNSGYLILVVFIDLVYFFSDLFV